jgi:hypothetical protein
MGTGIGLYGKFSDAYTIAGQLCNLSNSVILLYLPFGIEDRNHHHQVGTCIYHSGKSVDACTTVLISLYNLSNSVILLYLPFGIEDRNHHHHVGTCIYHYGKSVDACTVAS